MPIGGGPNGVTAAFGFRRLTLLDLTLAGHQLMINSITGDCLIFNGEVSKYRWLRAKLQSEGVRVTDPLPRPSAD